MDANKEKEEISVTPKQRLTADVTLLMVALIWGLAFVVQRIAAPQVGVFLFNSARFLLGALVMIVFSFFIQNGKFKRLNSSSSDRIWIGLAGSLLAAGAGFQQAGLQFTTAANAGFITGLYVVLIPLFLAIGFRQRLESRIWIAALFATIGLFLLSTNGQMILNAGDALVFLGSIFWGLHVILIGSLVKRLDVINLAIGQYLVCGIINLVIGLWLEVELIPELLQGWWTVAYTGLISVALGYTLQIAGQRFAPPADAAILLSLEAVFAALGGWIFLQEGLSKLQIVGCFLMLTGMLIAQLDLLGRKGKRLADG